ncbi:MAG: BON domain-containing protein [Candidatus Eremiobacteraeota bacterium]|nr:BON domain-containing protein [Candidatus Eremiobacteraeota bacterium]
MKQALLGCLAILVMGCSGPTEPPPTSIQPIDSAKVQAAKLNLGTDAELAPCNIQVSAENDMLVLKGGVPSQAGKERAETLVKKVEGIKKVANHLEVQPNTAQTPL